MIPARELRQATYTQWERNFTPIPPSVEQNEMDTPELYAALEAASIQFPGLTSVNVDVDEAVVEPGLEGECLDISKLALDFNERENSTFHTTVEITLDGGRGERRIMSRCRSLDTDVVLIFEDVVENAEEEGGVRTQSWVRVEDFAANQEGEVYVIGCELYTYMQLESHGSVVKNLERNFNRRRELVEGSNPCDYLLDDVIGFATVVSTESEANKQDCFFQNTAFVDDNPHQTWKLLQSSKPRNPVEEDQDKGIAKNGKRRRRR